jgi:hypothetical protein
MPFTVRRLSRNVNRLTRSYSDSAGSGGERRAVETAELGADLLGAGAADLVERADRLTPCPAGGVRVARAAVDVAEVIEGDQRSYLDSSRAADSVPWSYGTPARRGRRVAAWSST